MQDLAPRRKKDPPIRGDNKCARWPNCENDLIRNDDPFCSTQCCKIYWGVNFPSYS